ncbi:P-loop containing nucleoside triphosphate hydrolase protein [Jaminaea rosea]|uniref:P-loop containing nucleoside triphosphate hydrolase protein n=1 Tax=Jaminaea rosea TaxID=1569628 RepID=A0A316UWU0_9BASI|nr:P-loop containing nucleoside triphosphate hydrolase protein [Jaminaea rosea]PWN29692.1 P-loop containing nucleoside triphosphate hydrolase protein [Jaminaea rosea]
MLQRASARHAATSSRQLSIAVSLRACPAGMARSAQSLGPRMTMTKTLQPRSPAMRRCFSSSAPLLSTPHEVPLSAIRNISAWGHIDAGKTTLTERLLYHTGGQASAPDSVHSAANSALPGDVDSGSTVTDYLEQERERGITIQSAAVGPLWWKSQSSKDNPSAAITLVDTPGHIDFTIEVERALRVADGCIVVMDSVEGVEAQTEGNWKIGSRYGIKSNVLFLNKLDRPGASIARCLRSFVQRGLHARPLLLQLPILPSGSGGTEIDGGIAGVIDLLTKEELRFEGRAGEQVVRTPSSSPEIGPARHSLIESLASLDEVLMEELFSIESDDPHQSISAQSLRQSIRRLTIAGKIVPTLLGSAAKHVGVQPVLDAVVDYLPSPGEAGDVRDELGMGKGTVHGTSERAREVGRGGSRKPKVQGKATPPSKEASEKKESAAAASDGPRLTGEDDAVAAAEDANRVSINVQDPTLSCLAFKVVWDKRRGPMTFVRVYSGTLSRTTTLFNTSTGTRERLSRLLLPFGSTYTEVEKLGGGQVGVLLGLKDTRTGDTLVDARPAGGKAATMDPTLRLRPVDVPPPVFSVSVDAHSKSDEEAVNEALAMLVRTDPSLRLDSGSGDDAGGGSAFGAAGTNQTILSGMGELHLDIAKDRLKNEFGVKARIGGVRVAFRETVDEQLRGVNAEPHVVEDVLERDMGGKRVKAGARVTVQALAENEEGDPAYGDNIVEVRLGGEEGQKGNIESRSEAKSRTARGNKGDPASGVSNLNAEQRQARREGSKGATPAGSDETGTVGIDADSLRRSVLSGVTACLSRGPLASQPLTKLHIRVTDVQTFGPEQSPPRAVGAIIQSLVRRAVREAGARIAEPVMRVRIETEEGHMGRVVSDVTTDQGGDIVEVEHEGAAQEGTERRPVDVYLPPESQGEGGEAEGAIPGARQKTTIVALVPLTKLVSYSSRLRALTAGTGTFTMRLEGFRKVSDERQKQILEELGRV